MYPVRTSSLLWGVTVTFVLMLCALFVVPTLARGEGGLVLGHSVASGTSNFVGFGPVGPNCDAATAGPDCTFTTTSFSATGKAEPGGPFTETGTQTVLFGLISADGPFAYPNGAVDSLGNPAGFCAQTFGTAHVVDAKGTIELNFQGNLCCASSSCTDPIGGPPNTTQNTSVCISGTGKYAGIQCSGQGSASSTDGVHFVARGETVSTK
jgi:hypothetical protein